MHELIGLQDASALWSIGLRVSELVALRWDQVDLKAGHLNVCRAKNGTPSTHPMQGDELRALRINGAPISVEANAPASRTATSTALNEKKTAASNSPRITAIQARSAIDW